ncbi:MAG: transcriptional repressor [Deltaproteobacteria bacterium]
MIRFPFMGGRAGAGGRNGSTGEIRDATQHKYERDQFKEVLESFKTTRVADRLKVLDIFLSSERHLTLGELEEMVSSASADLQDRAFLKETMEMFCQFGFAQKLTFESRDVTYEHHHLGSHHDHFICTRCGSIQEFVNPVLEQLQMAIAKEHQFHALQHKMEIYGLCNRCMLQRATTLPLVLAAQGEKVKVVALSGGREARKRLTDMGLAPGVCLQVISNNPSGPFIVAINEARLALGAGIAQYVQVVHECNHPED